MLVSHRNLNMYSLIKGKQLVKKIMVSNHGTGFPKRLDPESLTSRSSIPHEPTTILHEFQEMFPLVLSELVLLTIQTPPGDLLLDFHACRSSIRRTALSNMT
jgi:hypothetical protein